MDRQTLKNMAQTDINTVPKESLVDIKDVTINMDKQKQERISDFLQQIKNPYCFTCNGIIVKISFSSNKQTLEELLESHFLSL